MGWSDNYLEHHGILGQKWGVRRFQNADGSLKPAGEKRYTKGQLKKEEKRLHKLYTEAETEGYKKNAQKVTTLTGKKYYDLIDSIEKKATKEAVDRYTKEYGDIHVDQIYNDKHAKYGAGRVAFWLKEG